MTLAMVFYGLAAAGLATLGAWALMTVFRMAGQPERWVWFSGLAVAVVLSIVPLLGASEAGGRIIAAGEWEYRATAIRELPEAGAAGGESVRRLGDWIPAGARIPWFLAIWGATSLTFLVVGVVVELRHRRCVGDLRRARVGENDVWLSRDEGPAVRGAIAPRLVLPERIDELAEDERDLVLAHEIEHLRAGDPQLNAAAFLAVVLVPWNPFAWILRRRVALAIESDCDRRALRRRNATPRDYVEVLLTVASWSLRPPPAPFRLAMGRSARDLRQRVERVLRPSPPRRAGAVAGVLLLGIGAVAPALADPPRPPQDSTPTGVREAATDTLQATFEARQIPEPKLRLGRAPVQAAFGEIVAGHGAFTLRITPDGAIAIETQAVDGEPAFEALAHEWLSSAGVSSDSDTLDVWVAALPDGSWRATPVSAELYARRGLRGQPELTLELVDVWASLTADSRIGRLPTVGSITSPNPASGEVR